jgi:hypothetical protein
MEQLHEFVARLQINNGYHIGVTERCVRIASEAQHGFITDVSTEIWRKDSRSELGIGACCIRRK